MEDLGNRLATGALWMVLLKFAARSLGLVSTVILARLLSPDDFGLIAMAMSVVFALELINAFGFELVLIQKSDAKAVHYDTAWSFRLLFAAAAALLLVLLAGPAAAFYEDVRLHDVIMLLALGTLVEGLHNIGTVEFLKEMRFRKEFQLRIVVKLVSFAITVPLALYLRSYWALLAGVLAGRVATVYLSYAMHPYRPAFSLAAWRDLIHFSSWVFIGNVLFFLRIRSADFVIGKLVGAAPLGIFSVAYEISQLPTTEVVMPVNRAAVPAYSKVSGDKAQLRRQFLNVNALVSIIAFPAGLGVASLADLMIPVLLGDQWLQAIDLIKVLALHGSLVAVQVNMSSIYLAVGRPKISAYLSAVYVLILLPSLVYFTAGYGPIGAAWSYLLTSVLVAVPSYHVLLRVLDMPVGSFLGSLWRPLVAATAMYFLVRAFIQQVGSSGSLLLDAGNLLLGALLGAATFSALDALFWLLSGRPDGAERKILDALTVRARRLLSRLCPSRP